MTSTSSLRPNLRSRTRWVGRWLVVALLAKITIWVLLVPEVLADASRTKADLEALSKTRVAALTAAQQPLIALADKYRAALQKQKETVQAAGDLDGVLAVDAALAELNADVEAADPPKDANVSRLRAIYLRERKALALRVQPEIAQVENDHLSRLEKLMTDLTKLGLIDDAKMVKKIRDELAADLKTRKATDVPMPATGEPRPGAVLASDFKGAKKLTMCWVPSGEFLMGSPETEPGRGPHEAQRKITTNGFWMAKTEVSKAQWDSVRKWALDHGYQDLPEGKAAGPDHPVQSVTWSAVIKWCNALSEMEELQPCYFTELHHAAVYRDGDVVLSNKMVRWDSRGYRLPTEAEWEKAARGGLNSKIFPWGDTISHVRANYKSDGGQPYDINRTRGLHPSGFTTEVGSFPANSYGLHDMSGNVWEWCWDLYDIDYLRTSRSTNPRGASTGSRRIFRGGSCFAGAASNRVSARDTSVHGGWLNHLGFRPVRSP